MLSRAFSAALLCTVALTAPVWAQSQNPAALAPESPPGAASPKPLNATDDAVLTAAAMGGAAEVDFAHLADHKTRADGVRQFARRMAEDHGKVNDRLTAFARQHNVTLAKGLDPSHAAMREHLDKASDGDFDRHYLELQVQDHQATALLLVYEIGSGQNADLKGIAADALPTVLEHLQMARTLLAETAAPGPAAATR